MSTFEPGSGARPAGAPAVEPVQAVVVPPEINKALWPAIMTVLTVITQFATSGEFTTGQEGLTALGGALATLLAFMASNYKKGLGFGKPTDKPAKVQVDNR